MPRYQACIFDLDGVLVDTADFHFKAWQRLANLLGVDFDIRDNNSLKGVSRKKSLEIILEKGGLNYSESQKEELTDLKNTWYLEYIHQLSPNHLLPGTASLLDQLEEMRIKKAVASASKNAGAVLSGLGITDRFEVIVDGNDVSRSKPDPEVFEKCVAALDFPPQHCVVFEDAHAGIVGARTAGMYTIGLGNKQDLPQAHLVLDSLQEVNAKLIDDLFK